MDEFVSRGTTIFESPYATRHVVRRVRGGYGNRWLIREETREPCAYVCRDPYTGRDVVIAHPAVADRWRAAAARWRLDKYDHRLDALRYALDGYSKRSA